MNLFIFKRACLVLMLLWMGVIFLMSDRDADTSTQDSERVGIMIGRILVHNFDELPEEERHAFASSIDHKVRKSAHAAEYALLGILALGALWGMNRDLSLAWLIATLYAVSDEVHQTFVPGRSGKFLDVINDSMGALAGIFVVREIVRLVSRKRARRDGE